MKTLTIGGKEFVLEFSFEAAQHKECVNKIFKMISGSYLGEQGLANDPNDKTGMARALVNGTSSMFSEIPDSVITAFYAGLMENNPVLNKVEAKKLLKAYFKENPDHASFFDAYEMIRECMEEDGFFKLTGLDSVQAAMNRAEEEMQKSTSEMSENQ